MDYVQLTREEYDLLRKTRDAMCYIQGMMSIHPLSEKQSLDVMKRVFNKVNEVMP